MSRSSKPWFRASTGTWYVKVEGKQTALGVRGQENEAEAVRAWHRLMGGMPLESHQGAPQAAEVHPTGPTVAAVVSGFLADCEGRVGKTGTGLDVQIPVGIDAAAQARNRNSPIASSAVVIRQPTRTPIPKVGPRGCGSGGAAGLRSQPQCGQRNDASLVAETSQPQFKHRMSIALRSGRKLCCGYRAPWPRCCHASTSSHRGFHLSTARSYSGNQRSHSPGSQRTGSVATFLVRLKDR
jgi:hypothetical protein